MLGCCSLPRVEPTYAERVPIPRIVAEINRKPTNKVMIHLAGHGCFVELEHVGRRSGKAYRNPLNAFQHGDALTFARTYGPKVDWPMIVVTDFV